jgi:amino acid transporter
MIGALLAYEGWNCGTFAAAEVKNPARHLPLSLMLGTGTVTALYLAVNLAYYHVLPAAAIARSPRVAADAAVRILGPAGFHLITWVVMITIFGCINSSILTVARVYYAMAQDGLFFRWCARRHPRFLDCRLVLLR